jgi:hypothetical protein
MDFYLENKDSEESKYFRREIQIATTVDNLNDISDIFGNICFSEVMEYFAI